MPLVQIQAIKGVFSPEAKKKIIEKVTDAMVQVEGENLRGVTALTGTRVSVNNHSPPPLYGERSTAGHWLQSSMP